MSHPSLRSLAVAAAAVLALSPAGCGWFEDPRPDRARAVLSSDLDEPVRVVLSKIFVAARGQAGRTRVELIESDTLEVTPPWERTVDIREEQRFFAQVTALDTVGSLWRMQVFLDDELRYDEERDLLRARLQFLYQINQPIVSDVDVF